MRRSQPLVLPNGYRNVRNLGEGGQASVVLAQKTYASENGEVVDELVAVKCHERGVLADSTRRNRVRREVCNLRRLRHPHINHLRTLKVTPTDLCVVLEYHGGGTLQDRLRASGKLSEDKARSCFQQLWLAVDFAHQMGVSNRDIKPANILFCSDSEDMLVLCDFGLSKYEHSLQGPSAVGTRGYGAPELMLPSGKRWTPEDLQKADAFSCGVTLFQMLFGVQEWPRYAPPVAVGQEQNRPPNHTAMLRSLMGNDEQELNFPGGVDSLSADCKALLTGLLQPNPRLRTTVGQIPTYAWFKRELPEGVARYNPQLLDAHYNGVVQNDHLPEESELIQLINEAAGVA